MPLSDHEQKMLEEMERALYAEDPNFASHMQGSSLRAAGRRLRSRQILGVAGVLVGIGVVVLAITIQQVWIGAIGFALMVASAAWALTPSRKGKLQAVPGAPSGAAKAAHPAKGKRPHASGQKRFMQRLEERWDRRREGH